MDRRIPGWSRANHCVVRHSYAQPGRHYFRHVSVGSACRPRGRQAQNAQICTPESATPCGGDRRHIGGSARGYQGLSALLAISTGGEQQAAQAVFLCIASAGRECALLPPTGRGPSLRRLRRNVLQLLGTSPRRRPLTMPPRVRWGAIQAAGATLTSRVTASASAS